MNSSSTTTKRPTGFLGLVIVLSGQAISILASGMTGFALSIWVFQKTSSATTLGIMTTAFTLPYLLIIPIAGVLVDRYNRKLMMAVSDLAAGLGTITILTLLLTGNLEIWHFYVVNAVIGLGNAFQWPAYSAAITTMVPKSQYGRANGLMSLVQAGPQIISPLLAGALMPLIQIQGILLIDIATFIIAIAALLLVHIPAPIETVDGKEGKGNFWHETTYGFKYILQRKPMVYFVIMIFMANVFLGFTNAVHVPMILLRTENNSLILGSVQTAGAISWTVGALLMSAWGGPKRRIYGTLLGWMFFCLFANVLFALGNSVASWVPLLLVAGLGSNIGIATSQAILQAKVAPDVQGRVFSARRLLTWFPDTFTPIVGGHFADKVMEPAMNANTWLATVFGGLVGNTPGSGMALIMFIAGICMILTMGIGFLIPSIRNMEDLLPDHMQG